VTRCSVSVLKDDCFLLDHGVAPNFCFGPGPEPKVRYQPESLVLSPSCVSPCCSRTDSVVAVECEFNIWKRLWRGNDRTMEGTESREFAGIDSTLFVNNEELCFQCYFEHPHVGELCLGSVPLDCRSCHEHTHLFSEPAPAQQPIPAFHHDLL
jgi:hypothetical protein